MIDRLRDDHANARLLAEGVNTIPGLAIDIDSVETNMVYVDHRPSGIDTETVLARLNGAGVLASSRAPSHIRLVPNRHHSEALIKEAVERIKSALIEV